MQAARRWLSLILLVFMLGAGPMQPALARPPASIPAAPALQTTLLTMISPNSCPSEGCAGGQRLGMRFEFSLTNSGYDTSDPNIEACIYAPDSWNTDLSTIKVNDTGEITRKPYSKPAGTGCAQNDNVPSGYTLIVDRVAQMAANTPRDALRFAFRLGADATGSGGLIAHLLVHRSSGWAMASFADSSILSIAVPATADPAYVANDAGTCGSNSPCYINSDGDVDGGFGTGLKDAVDALQEQTTIYILGRYTIKTATVAINQRMIIKGMDDSTITYTGSNSACKGAMLALNQPVTLRSLNIDDGGCTTHRNLVEINSHSGGTTANDYVQIISNDLTGGKNGIYISQDTTDRVIVRYNQISSSAEYGIFYQGDGGGPLEVTANSIYNNQLSSTDDPKPPFIQCGSTATGTLSNRKANHNYWGGGAPSADKTHCAIVFNKRMGGPIAHKSGEPGMRAQQVRVTADKTYATDLDEQIGYERSGSGGSDFNLFLVDYGFMPDNGAPFSTAQGGDTPNPCSNYWDVFLADGSSPSDNNRLELYFKYGTTSGCRTTINSNLYCNQTASPSKYPLYWLDPGGITDWWNPVGAPPANQTSTNGQPTTCHISDNEIQVSIDTSGRPSLSDLGYTPFMVGIPVIKSFDLGTTTQTVTIKWATNNETEISGFNILRGTSTSQWDTINPDLINHLGSSTTGYSYSKTDANLTNGTKYYYRLEVMRTDGRSFYSNWASITVNSATATSPAPTRTATIPYPTFTRTATRVPYKSPTMIPSRTYTPRFVAPTPTPLSLSTLTPTFSIDTRTPGALETLEAMLTGTPDLTQTYENGGAGYPVDENGTPIAALTMGPDQTPSAGGPGRITTPIPGEAIAGASTSSPHPWLSLLLGILAGLAATAAAGGIWYYTTRR